MRLDSEDRIARAIGLHQGDPEHRTHWKVQQVNSFPIAPEPVVQNGGAPLWRLASLGRGASRLQLGR